MEGEEEGGIRLSKRISQEEGEVDYKTKAGTAWSHSYLNQKPWHPLSYPNQRRKWIAEQTHAQRERRAEEVTREVSLCISLLFLLLLLVLYVISICFLQYAQEQEFFRQTALISKKDREKVLHLRLLIFCSWNVLIVFAAVFEYLLIVAKLLSIVLRHL